MEINHRAKLYFSQQQNGEKGKQEENLLRLFFRETKNREKLQREINANWKLLAKD